MEKEERLKNKINYWLKHQELDKFNYNFATTFYPSMMAMLTAGMVPFLIYFANKDDFTLLVLLSLLFLIVLFLLTRLMLYDRYTHNRGFRIREAMLRVWYNEKEIGVNTDKLDQIFGKIKSQYKQKMKNKDLENIARDFMAGIQEKNNEQKENKKRIKLNWLGVVEIVALTIAIFGIGLSYYQIESPKLIVNQSIVDNGDGTGRLKIYVENNALLKPTGTINFFRLDVNPDIPHMQVESLKPGKNITFDTSIIISEKDYNFQQEEPLPGAFSKYGIPAHKLYFIMEDISLSYRITCDNCHSQGILKRVPELGTIETGIKLNVSTGEQSGFLKIYDWTTYSREDLFDAIII